MRLKTVLIIAGVVIGLPVVGVGVFLATLDANTYKPQIIEAARNATGRELRLSGPIRIKPSLTPTLAVEDVGFANAPGGARPEMATLKRLEIEVALLPLLSRELRISRLVLVEPDILLERNSEGRGNWEFTPPAPQQQAAPASPSAPSAPAAPAQRQQVTVDKLRIENGRVAFTDATTKRAMTLAIRALDAAAPGGYGPVALDMDASYNDNPFIVALRGGPLARLMAPGPGPAPPWPIDATITAAGARVAAKGEIAEPTTAKGFRLAIEGTVPDVARLAAFLPDLPLPPLNNVAFSVRAADSGGAIPEISALNIRIGESNLGALRDGLVLRRLEAQAENLTAPLVAKIEATLSGVPVAADARLGALAAFLPGAARENFPIAINASAGAARLAIEGAVADIAAATGLDARVTATVPDLAALSPLAGQPLPALKDIAFSARLRERGQGGGVIAEAIDLKASGADLTGTATFMIGARNRLEAQLASKRIDADALLAAMPALPTSTAPPAPPTDPPRPAPTATRMIPDTPLPLDALRLMDAAVTMTVGELVFAEQPYRDIAARVNLDDGNLRVRDVRATMPSGALSGSVDVDARQDTPPVAIVLRAPGLDLNALTRAAGLRYDVRGRMELDVNVKGRGASPAAIASTLDGSWGIAVDRAVIDNRLIDLVAGDFLRFLSPGMPRDGSSNVQCLAVRFDSQAGRATARVLLFDSSLAKVSGTGGINLANESLALRMSPTVKIAGGGVSVPVNVTGSFLRPAYRVDPAGALGALGELGAGAAAGAGQGAMIGGPLGAIVGGVVGATQQGRGEARGDDCPAALALARGVGAPAAAPAPANDNPAPAPAPQQRAPEPRRQEGPIPGLRLPRGLFGN
jgi:uncharacterized protein involved in outer membrane biogenesis